MIIIQPEYVVFGRGDAMSFRNGLTFFGFDHAFHISTRCGGIIFTKVQPVWSVVLVGVWFFQNCNAKVIDLVLFNFENGAFVPHRFSPGWFILFIQFEEAGYISRGDEFHFVFPGWNDDQITSVKWFRWLHVREVNASIFFPCIMKCQKDTFHRCCGVYIFKNAHEYLGHWSRLKLDNNPFDWGSFGD